MLSSKNILKLSIGRTSFFGGAGNGSPIKVVSNSGGSRLRHLVFRLVPCVEGIFLFGSSPTAPSELEELSSADSPSLSSYEESESGSSSSSLLFSSL